MALTNQELLERIAPYLPYGVKAYDENKLLLQTDTIIGIFRDTLDFNIWSPCNSYINNYKIVLRPLSNLTKPCLEGGKVPIDELIKYVCNREYHLVDISEKNNTYTARFKCNEFDCSTYYFLDVDTDEFGVSCGVECEVDEDGINNDKYYPINNILGIVSFLFKHHFDVFNLIEKGYAIDINTLKNE